MPDLNPAPTALLTGATGALGPVLAWRLSRQGYRLKVLARRQPPPNLLPKPHEMIVADITDRPALETAAAKVDVIFHLAAKLHLPNPSPDLAPVYERVNVEGTQALVEAARTAGVPRLVFFSTISVYGPGCGQALFDERSVPNPQTLYAQTKCRAEQILLAAMQPQTGWPLGVVLRLAAVYGPRIKGNYARLVRALRRKRFVPVGPGRNRRTLVHEQDVASAALLAASLPQAAGQIYNVTGGPPVTVNQILTAICHGLGQPPPRWHLPVAPVRCLAGLAEDLLDRLGKTSPVSRFTIDKYLEDVAVSGQKIQQELNFQPCFDLESGWTTTINQMG